MAIAKPKTYRARKPRKPRQQRWAPQHPAQYHSESAPGVHDLASAVGYANTHGNPTAAAGSYSYDPGDTVPQTMAPYATPPSPSDPGQGGGTPSTPGTPGTPPPAAGPPPPTGVGDDLRTTANTNYGTSMADINSRILAAALAYGGVGSVQQAGLGADGSDIFNNAAVGPNPNSAIAQTERALKDQTRGLSEDLNNRNSYFSGAHLEDQGRLNDSAGRDRLAAQQAYDSAIGALLTELSNARAARDSGIRQGNNADIDAASASEPQAEAGTPGTDGTPGTTPPPTTTPSASGEPVVKKVTAQRTTGKKKTHKVKRPKQGKVKVA